MELCTLPVETNAGNMEPFRTAICKSVQRTVTHLKEEVEAVEAEIQAIIDADPPLLARQAKLESVQGIGPRVARVIVSEFPELGRIGRAQAAALVGVAPFNDDSGTHTGARSIRGGRHTVRAAIYMATLVATRQSRAPELLSDRLAPSKLRWRRRPFPSHDTICRRPRA